jgi:rRNA maturation RNase YbeY
LPHPTKPDRLRLRRPGISVQVFNRQETRRVNLALFGEMARSLLINMPPRPGQNGANENSPINGQLGIHLIAAAEMACLNEEFLGHAGSTDVITFNYQEDKAAAGWCGEIFISVDDAVACAPRFRVGWTLELARYLAHGLLHLRGYDDRAPASRREMKMRENRLIKVLSRRFACAKLERRKNAARR